MFPPRAHQVVLLFKLDVLAQISSSDVSFQGFKVSPPTDLANTDVLGPPAASFTGF